MPVPKIAFKSTVLDLELDNVEITVGPEVMKVGHFKASVDVADLLRVQLPELMRGDTMGVMLIDYGPKKIQCIKEIRAMTGRGLKEAKEFVESAPKLLTADEIEFMPGADIVEKAEEAARILKASGAQVEVCYGTERIPTVLDKFREMLVAALSERVQVSDESAEE